MKMAGWKSKMVEDRRAMNEEYDDLIIRYGVAKDGTWRYEVQGDLRMAASLIAKPLTEVYKQLEIHKGYVRTQRYEVESKTKKKVKPFDPSDHPDAKRT
jgi:hypothetical protein